MICEESFFLIPVSMTYIPRLKKGYLGMHDFFSQTYYVFNSTIFVCSLYYAVHTKKSKIEFWYARLLFSYILECAHNRNMVCTPVDNIHTRKGIIEIWYAPLSITYILETT